MKHIFFIITLLCLCLCGCGYRFSKGELPEGIKSMNIDVFENNTGESGIETIFTNDFIYEFTRRSNVNIINKDNADAVLYGTVKSMRVQGITHDKQQSSIERRVTITLDLKFENKQTKKIRFFKNVADSEAYRVESDISDTENNRRAGIEKLSKRIAEAVYGRLTDDF